MTASLVCFDVGGVLVRICQTWQDAFRAAGLVPTQAEPLALQALAEFDRHQEGAIPSQALWSAVASRLGCSAEEAALAHRNILLEFYPGVPELLDDLSGQGVRLGCLSNTNEEHWLELTTGDRFRPVSRFDVKMASHREQLAKPDRRLFERFQEKAGTAASEIVYFDDVPVNVEAARACGWQAFRVDPLGDPATQMRQVLGDLGVLPPPRR